MSDANRISAWLETLLAVQADYERCAKHGYSLPRDLVEDVDDAIEDMRAAIEELKEKA